ncbi:hypothetical protein RHGRI_021051 [Rhododendron griersonianum]|uniref:Uncharacterized protein n=1 Tax=Rhododendron griersonianum TaxID=479676 RepID=A0AAV6JM07_9ERIC|nr:hypothetical protein RHGRI_021051 [Rhododendron griersonianum]
MYLYRKLVSTKVDGSTDKDLESGVEQLLRQLKQVISHMQAWVSSGSSEIYSHTLTRHQEILLDLTQNMCICACIYGYIEKASIDAGTNRNLIGSDLAFELRKSMLHCSRISMILIGQD